MVSGARDDFAAKTVLALRERVGGLCSNPRCRKPTTGPVETEPDRVVRIGVAAHITAAAEGGPRYDPRLTPDERRSPENGIWLCQNCARLVDRDVQRYTVAELRRWKARAEDRALRDLEGPAGVAPAGASGVSRPGLVRYAVDRLAPRLHRALTRLGGLSEPPELRELEAYLRGLRASIESALREKTYLPLDAHRVPPRTLPPAEGTDPFVEPVHQTIREIVRLTRGGDSASARVSAATRRSRNVRNILRSIRRSREPLVLLGDPGSGKTMTLQEVTRSLADSESRRVYPRIPIFVRLGDFFTEHRPTSADVLSYVREVVPEEVSGRLDDLLYARRLVLMFDGMDEMSREHYGPHLEALSTFASECRGIAKTLFSCRINDFSEAFLHKQLVLLPFTRRQIVEFLKAYVPRFPLTIDGEAWSARRLARRIVRGDTPLDADNPFVLWLLVLHLHHHGAWPETRTDLLGLYNETNYERKLADAGVQDAPPAEEAFREWGRIAYRITLDDQGTSVAVDSLLGDDPSREARAVELIQVGIRCGVLAGSRERFDHLVRFEHHRFQEYFAARHIAAVGPEVDWLEKLDAPRWQETLFNVVLMGGGGEGLALLADSITDPIQAARRTLAEREAERAREEGAAGGEAESRADEKDASPADAEGADRAETPTPPESSEASPPVRVSEDHEAELAPLSEPSAEVLLADRVELASRILRQGRSVPTVHGRLLPPLRDAVAFLSEHGTPSTQVKMLWACQNTPETDLVAVLKEPLRSPVRWVRNQALMVLAESRGRPLGSDLVSEMAYDVADGRFFHRSGTYVRAVSAAGGRAWACLVAAVLGAVTQVGVLAATAAVLWFGGIWVAGRLADPSFRPYGLYERVYSAISPSEPEPPPAFGSILHGAGDEELALLPPEEASPWTNDVVPALIAVGETWLPSWLAHPWATVLAGLLSVAALFVVLRREPQLAWVAAAGPPLAVAVASAIAAAGWSTSFGTLFVLGFTLLSVGGGAIAFAAGLGILTALAGALGIWTVARTCGLPLTIGLRPLVGRAFAGTRLVGLGVGAWAALTLAFVLILSPVVEWGLGLLGTLLSVLVQGPLEALGGVVPFDVDALLAVVAVAVVGTALVAFFVRSVRQRAWSSLLRVSTVLLVVVGAIVLIATSGERVFESAFGATEAAAPYVRRAVGIVVFAALVFLAGALLVFCLRELAHVLAARRSPFPPGSWDPGAWADHLRSLPPARQQRFLARTNHQSLALEPDGYLGLLVEMQPVVTKEPALSTYWSSRHRLEQTIRQERVG